MATLPYISMRALYFSNPQSMSIGLEGCIGRVCTRCSEGGSSPGNVLHIIAAFGSVGLAGGFLAKANRTDMLTPPRNLGKQSA